MEIFVNFLAIDTCIIRLRALQARCQTFSRSSSQIMNLDGNVATSVMEILNLYRKTGQSVSEMIEHSIAFLENAKHSMKQSDEIAKHLISQEVKSGHGVSGKF